MRAPAFLPATFVDALYGFPGRRRVLRPGRTIPAAAHFAGRLHRHQHIHRRPAAGLLPPVPGFFEGEAQVKWIRCGCAYLRRVSAAGSEWSSAKTSRERVYHGSVGFTTQTDHKKGLFIVPQSELAS
eukprot:9494545-Pyramimonas_sp.AAC.1